ncbi:phospholipid methyltransferase [Dokdonella sp.]|uniref:class I SAM-dependent methyltransferase n=1 Tax=Dokdonella sp. TaxID=2291710 RepID=UPI0025C68DC4|nr:phospholipid methyltransferase [Dokdonella sp.]
MNAWLETRGEMARRDRSLFLRSWLRDPLRIGSAWPSGRALAQRVARHVGAVDAPVVELGAGTGAITRALLRSGVPEHRLALIEADPHFARALLFRFPQARVLHMDAAAIGEVGPFFGRVRAGAFVSAVPPTSLSTRRLYALLASAFRHHLRSDGVFYQFTCLPRCPVPSRLLARLGLCAERVGWVGANLPPVAVYRLQRSGKPPSPAAARRLGQFEGAER